MSKLIWKEVVKTITELKPYEFNPRNITDKGLEDLTISINKFGLAEPIVINTDNVIIGGHARYFVLKNSGTKDCKCYVPNRKLTEDEVKELNIRLKMARAIEEIWPQYVQVKWRFGRPQHFVDWGKHFKHNLIRRDDIDWDEVSKKKFDLKLVKLAEPSNSKVAAIYEQELQNG